MVGTQPLLAGGAHAGMPTGHQDEANTVRPANRAEGHPLQRCGDAATGADGTQRRGTAPALGEELIESSDSLVTAILVCPRRRRGVVLGNGLVDASRELLL